MMRFISVFKNHSAVFFPVAALCMTFCCGITFYQPKEPDLSELFERMDL